MTSKPSYTSPYQLEGRILVLAGLFPKVGAVINIMPQWLKYIFGGSGIVPAGVIAILLNLIIPKDKVSES